MYMNKHANRWLYKILLNDSKETGVGSAKWLKLIWYNQKEVLSLGSLFHHVIHVLISSSLYLGTYVYLLKIKKK